MHFTVGVSSKIKDSMLSDSRATWDSVTCHLANENEIYLYYSSNLISLGYKKTRGIPNLIVIITFTRDIIELKVERNVMLKKYKMTFVLLCR